jgi:hypothetical protein
MGLTATFALDVEPAWSGNASLTWGVDLNTMETGFANAGTATVKLTFLDGEAVEAAGEGTVYGWIELAGASLALDSTDGAASLTGAGPDVTAKLFIGPAWIKIYSAPGMAFDYAADVEGVADGVANSDYAGGGFTLGLPAGPAAIEIYVVSMDDWTGAQDNNYAVGGYTKVVFAPVTLEVYAVTGVDWLVTDYIGFGASANVNQKFGDMGIVLDVDADAQLAGGAFAWEVAGGTDLVLVYNADGDAKTMLTLDASYNTTADLDFKAGFTHDAAAGFVPNLAAGLSVMLYNITNAMATDIEASGSYDIDGIVPGFAVGYDLGLAADGDEVFDVNVYLTLGGLVPLTVFKLDYTSAQLLTGKATAQDLGAFTFATTITYE